jgi:hypothetical protein
MAHHRLKGPLDFAQTVLWPLRVENVFLVMLSTFFVFCKENARVAGLANTWPNSYSVLLSANCIHLISRQSSKHMLGGPHPLQEVHGDGQLDRGSVRLTMLGNFPLTKTELTPGKPFC